MTGPTFVGVGVPRGGTTWLHELLAAHPDIYVPERRKEIHYFSLHFERGPEWYAAFFPPEGEAHQYTAFGEISPSYFYMSDLECFATVPGIRQVIVMLRNPVERAYSYYGLYVRDRNYRDSFEQFLEEKPAALSDGLYAAPLARYRAYFGRAQVLALIQERAVADVPAARRQLAAFLDVAPERFPAGAGERRVNPSYVPRHGGAYAAAAGAARLLRRVGVDGLVNRAKTWGVKRAFGQAARLPSMAPDTRARLQAYFRDEVARLEEMLETDLACWR